MHMRAGLALLGGAACLVASQSACLYPERNVQAFDPKTEIGYSTGRLYVMPNPLHLTHRIPADGRHCRYVEVSNIGTESIALNEVIVEGSPAISHYYSFTAPYILQPHSGSDGFEVCFDESVGTPREGALLFVTDDPVSPVLRLPILVEDGAAVDPAPNWPKPLVSPNPIRLVDNVEGDRFDVLLSCEACSDEYWLRFDEATAGGSLVEIDGLRSTAVGGTALSFPQKITVTYHSPDRVEFALGLRIVAAPQQSLRDTLTLRVSNAFGERYEIGVPVLTE